MATKDTEHTTLRIRQTPYPQESVKGDEEAELIVLVGHASGRRFHLTDQFEIGRGPECPLEILDDGVSRRHALIQRLPNGGFEVQDLSSRNGTFVNGERIERKPLQVGDKIAVGSGTVLLFARRDRFEEQRLQAQKLQALGQLAGGIAHDFNNLLGVVLANITHMQSLPKLDEHEVRGTLAEVETAARRAVDLTHQLLAFARSGRRGQKPVDVSTLIDDAIRLLGRTLQRNIELHREVDKTLFVVGDSSQLLQVLMNLCINAGDAMPRGGRLRIAAQKRALTPSDLTDSDEREPGDYVCLRVEDEGEGIDPSILDRVFEPFFTTKPRGKGTGLGLATADAIVRDHGGHMRVESEPGRGTTFSVWLPGSSLEAKPASRPTLDPVRQLEPNGGVILLADDEELIRLATRRVLEHAGFEVVLACDGIEAVEQFERNRGRLDAVLLDLDMPRLDGHGVLTRLRAAKPDLPVLISSGYLDRDRERTLIDEGAAGVLSKPYDSRTLVRTIARIVQDG